PARTHEAIERTVGEVVSAGAIPVVLGGDHSIAEPDVRACAAGRAPIGLVHFDTHTDTGTEVFGVEVSHGTPMYRLVEAGVVDPRRYVQIGLRGYWPGEKEFRWQEQRGITSFFMHDVRRLGIEEVVGGAIDVVGSGPVYLSVDVDVLDPAFAPGTGTPEPSSRVLMSASQAMPSGARPAGGRTSPSGTRTPREACRSGPAGRSRRALRVRRVSPADPGRGAAPARGRSRAAARRPCAQSPRARSEAPTWAGAGQPRARASQRQ